MHFKASPQRLKVVGRTGFSLVELMVVILIVAIIGAAVIPILKARIDAAKWTEGKTLMGTIATALRAYIAIKEGSPYSNQPSAIELGIAPQDLNGSYFSADDFEWLIISAEPIQFKITAHAPDGIWYPRTVTLDQSGTFTEE